MMMNSNGFMRRPPGIGKLTDKLMSAMSRKQTLLESDFVLSYSRLDVTASLSADSLARGSLTPSDRDQA